VCPTKHLPKPIHSSARSAEKELLEHLRSKRRIRRSQHSRIFKDGAVKSLRHLHQERPAEVEDRAIPGHWEGDLLRGSGNSHIATWWNAIRALSC